MKKTVAQSENSTAVWPHSLRNRLMRASRIMRPAGARA